MNRQSPYFRPWFPYHHLHTIQPSPFFAAWGTISACPVPAMSRSFLLKLSQRNKSFKSQRKEPLMAGLQAPWQALGESLGSSSHCSVISCFTHLYVWPLISIFTYRLVVIINKSSSSRLSSRMFSFESTKGKCGQGS